MENRTDNLETPKLISFIIPCYHSAKTLPFVVEEIERTMQALPQYRTQIVMVNDDPKDGTWSVIQQLCHEKTGRDGICFARNFGQHAALMAGIRRAQGDILVCLDDDGQTPACEAPELIAAIENGADAAYAKYEKKQHSGFRNFGSSVNEKMCEILLGKPKELYVSSYFAMRRFVAEEVKRYENSYPYLLGLVLRSTTSIVNVPVHHRKRESGTSGYTLRKLFGLWMNGTLDERLYGILNRTAPDRNKNGRCFRVCFLYLRYLYNYQENHQSRRTDGIFGHDDGYYLLWRNADAHGRACGRVYRKNVHLC